MTNPLIPELSGRTLSVAIALNNVPVLRERIAKIAERQLLMPKFFRAYGGGNLEAGGFLYSILAASDMYSSAVEKRQPGAEYVIVEGVDPDPKLALVEQWGGKFKVPDEIKVRNNISFIDQETTQLANTITRVLDARALAELAAADIEDVAVSEPWDGLVMAGDPADLSPTANLPTTHFAAAQNLADLEEMGIILDTLLVHPDQALALRTAYAGDLGKVLEGAGLTMISNARLTAGTAYLVQSGGVGTVGYEAPLTVETWDDRSIQSTWVQAFCKPAYAVDRPYAAKKLVGLAS